MKKKIKLSFCPTMQPYAKIISDNNKNIILNPSSSAANVLNMLNQGIVNVALIGREAYSCEISSDIEKFRLKNGYTIVYNKKILIPEEKLYEIPIKTYLSEDTVKKVLPNHKNILYFNTFKECHTKHDELPMLINWKDFSDEFKLLIPVNSNGNKTPIFRAPILYYRKELREKIKKEIVANVK